MRKAAPFDMRLLAFASLSAAFSLARAQPADKDFTIYFVDVEGGQSVLYISPTGKTLMTDAGYPGAREGRSPAPPGDPARFIRPTGHIPARWIRVTAHSDGTFAVLNPRNNFSKTYYGGRWQQ
jgi:hypothetical protein